MGRMGNFDISGLEKLRDDLNRLHDPDDFVESCAKELAARLLRMVVKRTPVGDYSREIEVIAKRDSKKHKKGEVYKKKVNPSGKIGGTLRRGWTGGEKASAKDYADSLAVNHFGDTYVIEIVNPVEYGSYVEFGHRTANHKGWVRGQFMMTISERELQRIAPKVLEKRIKDYLEGGFR
ncbi:MAG: HK97 gp10 family phage protein [Lachnospiraceae bacterium]|nr:HK97 gp10 family phage protein [Lachnospiraceae bacterium]